MGKIFKKLDIDNYTIQCDGCNKNITNLKKPIILKPTEKEINSMACKCVECIGDHIKYFCTDYCYKLYKLKE